MVNNMYQEKKSDYFSGARTVIIDLVPSGVNRVLEIGCGYGQTLLMLKKRNLCKETVGIELVESVASEASKNVDRIYALNVEKSELPSELGEFDLILLLDVLEHLVDPWGLLLKLKSNCLSKKGKVIISLPNARHFGLVLPLLSGSFDYVESGILDKTHLRFFTKKSAIALVKSAGLNVEKIKRKSLNLNLNSGKLNFVTFGLFSDFIATHYVLLCGNISET
jgi:2-polyprenyl-3-methyl-5-hydroxy-6-metoxy-1,4-benzoquinol methylase